MSFDKKETYERSIRELDSVLEGQTDRIAIMATLSCVLKMNFPYYFWSGFYMVKNGALLIGPYQGALGCLDIEFGRGVCGTAAAERKTQLVPDVHQFPGHIACDANSKSEIVVPVIDAEDNLIAVFDVDSDEYNSFDETDQIYLEKIVERYLRISEM